MLRTALRHAGRVARPLTVAVSLSFAGTELGAQAVELRKKHEVGSEQVYRTTTSTTISGTMFTQSQTMASVIRQRVDSVAADGSAVLSVTTQTFKMTIDGPLGRMEYDSETGVMPTGPLAGIASGLAELVGQTRQFKVDREGTLVSMEGLPGLQGPNELGLPAGAVRVGEEWERQANVTLPTELSAGGAMNARSIYRLREIAEQAGRRIAVIDVTVQGTLEVGALAGAGPMPIDSSGEIYFDIERGIVIRSVQRQKTTMALMGESMQTTSETVTELIP